MRKNAALHACLLSGLLSGLLSLAAPPAQAQTAPEPAAPATAAASAPPAAAGAPETQPSCSVLSARAMSADVQSSTAQAKDLDTQARLLDEALQLWTAAVARCEGRARERAQRLLADNQKQRAAIAERQAAGSQCESSFKDAGALQDLARQTLGERRWGEAGALFRKAEVLWDLAAEQCTGARQELAGRNREKAELDGHNAEFCAPPFERAREQTQKLRSAAAAAAPEKQRLSLLAETAWREAIAACKGSPQELAQGNAQALARERGTPWVATAPAAAPAAPRPGNAAPAAAATPALPGAAAAPTAVATAPAQAAAAAAPPPAALKEIDVRSGDTRYKGLFVREEGQVVSGSGRVEWANGDVYEGELLRGKRQGQGELIWANGQRYQGEWVDDRPSGRGQLRFANGDRFEGSVVDGVPEGEGRMDYASGDSYQGQIRRGVPSGRGRYQWANGQVYEGEWVDEKPQGRGLMRFANGNRYEGSFQQGLPHGRGKMQFPSGGAYEGELVQGVSEGQGSYSWPGGDRYSGAWRAGLKHGQGQFVWANGDRWEGEFRDDERTENGTLKRKE